MSAVCVSIPVTVLRSALRLPGDAEILAAVSEADPDGSLSLALMIEFPGAPSGAVAAEPDYAQPPASWSGPVALMGIRWLDAAGVEIAPRFPGEPIPPEAAPASQSPGGRWFPFGLGDGESGSR